MGKYAHLPNENSKMAFSYTTLTFMTFLTYLEENKSIEKIVTRGRWLYIVIMTSYGSNKHKEISTKINCTCAIAQLPMYAVPLSHTLMNTCNHAQPSSHLSSHMVTRRHIQRFEYSHRHTSCCPNMQLSALISLVLEVSGRQEFGIRCWEYFFFDNSFNMHNKSQRRSN